MVLSRIDFVNSERRRDRSVTYQVDFDCRLCDSTKLNCYLDLGTLPLADAFTTEPITDSEQYYFPLKVNLCQDCGWSQLTHVISSEVLYQRDYPYDSTITKTGESHWLGFASDVIRQYKLNLNDLVLDIGSNTGALLKQFKSLGMQIIGIDPSSTAAEIANRNGIETIPAFFSNSSANLVKQSMGLPKVITATNSFAHVDDLNAWASNVASILHAEGVLIIESPHILELVRFNQFDTVYHEHLSYVSLAPLIAFFHKHGLEIIQVDKQQIHGGSVRIHVAHSKAKPVTESVFVVLEEERSFGLRNLDRMRDFATDVSNIRKDFLAMLGNIHSEGKSVGIASAPAKGMTLINYLGINASNIVGISDKSNLKIGRYAPGTKWMVISDKELLELAPDFIIILAWNFKKEIMQNLTDESNYSPRFIIPIPNPVIY